MDPFSAHRHHVSALLSGFGSSLSYDPFLGLTEGRNNHPSILGDRHLLPPSAIAPFGMFGMGRSGFSDMFGMMDSMFSNMNSMMGNLDPISPNGNCQTYSSSTVISYSNGAMGTPKVYQSTSETRSAPGGIRETMRSVRDSESGLEKIAIGHHIRDRCHIVERSRNRHTGDREHSQQLINIEEGQVQAFDEEWRRQSRYSPCRGLDYRRGGRGGASGTPRPAIAYTPSPGSRRYDW
uniref:Myeloid leukemia factor 2 n=1 Tax=Callorhinchus milii TaxID=7868 RepID=V9LAN4_CALMI